MDLSIKQEPTMLSTNGRPNRSETYNKTSRRRKEDQDPKRRKCVSTACIACRKRKSKCDGAQPACAACVSVYNTECVYDPSSDHRRKGVYKKDADSIKTRSSTLQTLIHAILNYPEDEVPGLVASIRACESLDKVAESINTQNKDSYSSDEASHLCDEDIPQVENEDTTFESRLASKVGELKLDHGAMRLLGGTSNLLFLEDDPGDEDKSSHLNDYRNPDDPVASWTTVTSDRALIMHILNFYFSWHFPQFTILDKGYFFRQFYLGMPPGSSRRKPEFCTSLLVNAMLALGCHFTSAPAARANPEDPDTAGDHFFQEAKRQIYEQDELAIPSLATVQALALMSVREAGCGRESRGWVYSGMAFRMACDLGLSYHSGSFTSWKQTGCSEEEEDARRITFWGCFMIDKCWSQYLGRLPMFQLSTNTTVPKFEVFPMGDSDRWAPYYDSGFSEANSQPSRTRAVALRISTLCEISSDLIQYFYHPQHIDKPISKQQEMKKLSDIHSRLEEWKRELPQELEPKEGTLSSVLIMHMMFQLLYIHLFRPFLKYNQQTSPLPSHVSPRRLCTQAAGTISKLLRLYKRSHGLRQIVNIAVYICHSACTIHLLNLPEKTAKRDITHGIKHLEEIADGWMCARRTLCVLSTQAQKWNIDLPEEAAAVLSRTDAKYGKFTKTRGSNNSPQAMQGILRNLDGRAATSGHEIYANYPDSTAYPKASMTNNVIAPPPYSLIQPNPFGNILPSDEPLPETSGSNISSTAPSADLSVVSPETSTRSSPKQQFHVQTFSEAAQHVTSKHREPARNSRKRKEALMFGGVEALLQEGQDWWLNDQASVASGFSNWTYGADAKLTKQQKQNELPDQSFTSAGGTEGGVAIHQHASEPNFGATGKRYSIGQIPDFSNSTGPPRNNYQQNDKNHSGVPAFGNYTNPNEAAWYE